MLVRASVHMLVRALLLRPLAWGPRVAMQPTRPTARLLGWLRAHSLQTVSVTITANNAVGASAPATTTATFTCTCFGRVTSMAAAVCLLLCALCEVGGL